ncbi:HAD family hydrolase [Myceligenerans indicum]|uniref:HAD-IA family hydrolase n=1 Tax=Myceligenerans indicum TaxID=2593663 RepID=A0ABS1LIE4_9MICO|nr:HAD-IA family hydrolase [Myceligenerans indicum]MBL0886001.1 HAD-IA family hydrolase [Myceligenerans indicum]
MTTALATLDLGVLDAVVLDTDGVITDTARVHAAAWKRAFDEILGDRDRDRRDGGRREDTRTAPFDIGSDYLRFVDGRSRADGARTFLASRGIVLPEREGAGSLEALLDRKTGYFLEEVAEHGVRAFPSTVTLLRELRDRGAGIAAVSASRNCGAVLHAAGVDGLVDVRVDGVDAARLDLPGKPDPALFQEAARRLAVPPGRCALVEDSLVGVEAGRRGGFGSVVGVDRQGRLREDLAGRGADVVVRDLAELTLVGRHHGARHPLV